MNAQKGFTLIELMIVVAIIGILAAIAIPQYQNYVGRSNVASAVQTLTSNKTGLENYVMENGFFPDGKKPSQAEVKDAQGNVTTPYLPDQRMKEGLGIVQPSFGAITLEQKSTTAGTGNIVLTFNTGNPGIKGNKVQLHRAEDGTWTCETTIDGKYAAKSCSVVTSLSAAS
ncbi:pilin [Acinetobacter pittii]|uniref:pilin n=1 Tax=Acinetobacter TaxID=469 RepID=UPI00083D6E74|nr:MULTISPECIES: pilin [Acinetobacter]MCU4433126.1 pilin [Acinetobacter pittii]MCU4534707.1 pilin [Acinetobacter pittii]MDA3453209.1 pilin [Acinetobacter sp. AOR43_HL]MZY06671.1 prepilin-type N-terminal cleavage/methylation domain-containing protein [Acinetobacter pittii]ODI90197.1 prepilin-type N-terminal cleavage/methylation domain-containing protein [Acinetobacter pittii]